MRQRGSPPKALELQARLLQTAKYGGLQTFIAPMRTQCSMLKASRISTSHLCIGLRSAAAAVHFSHRCTHLSCTSRAVPWQQYQLGSACQRHLRQYRKSVERLSFTMPALATNTDSVISGLQPKTLWTFFENLSQIPRPSKHEQR